MSFNGLQDVKREDTVDVCRNRQTAVAQVKSVE